MGAGGIVGYSAAFGNSGNTVAIVHPGGWVTAYGHTRRTLVAAGALVRRGQVIAEVGDTGDAHGCHVHFIVARNGTRLDPEQHVTGRPGSAPLRRTGAVWRKTRARDASGSVRTTPPRRCSTTDRA